MIEDPQYQTILDALTRLELSQARTFQNYEDHKIARKDLPKDIQDLKDKTTKDHTDCEHHTAETRLYFKKVDFLMTWYGRGAAFIFAFQILIAAMVLLGRIIDIKYTIKP